ncbi:MAG: amino acid adenylation domain-containing protein [Rubrivivax sp.]|nr:amino acid adenylation domain-containing protein [Rubrivivax sp.]
MHCDRTTARLRPFEGFELACQRQPQARALEIGTRHWSYAELQDWSLRLAALLSTRLGRVPSERRVGVLASRSLSAYGGSLAVLASGATLVALNPAYPPQRNATILRRAGIQTLIVGEEGLAQLPRLQAALEWPLEIIAPESVAGADTGASPGEGLWDARHMATPAPWLAPARSGGEALAYIVFTSGSTGEPKGVAISHDNLCCYMRNFRELAPAHADDRVATTYELTFDVALHDMLNAWWSGATLVVMPERAMLAPARFILDQRISVWFSVASFAMILQKQGLLRPGLFPGLRLSLLCGEALPLATATAWAAAAPHSELYNVWGPTETTMELSFYRWERGSSEAHCRRGVVPIGVPFADHRHLLLDEQGQAVQGAGCGELYVQGPQVGPGYWQDEARTAASFVTLPSQQGRWYKSGDRVERDALGVYHFVSRVDFMVKIRGNRIELGDVEDALRKASGNDLVAVMPQPALDGLAQGLVAFVCGAQPEAATAIRERLKTLLPKALLPDEIRVLPQLPMNANRKIDRTALAATLAQPAGLAQGA